MGDKKTKGKKKKGGPKQPKRQRLAKVKGSAPSPKAKGSKLRNF